MATMTVETVSGIALLGVHTCVCGKSFMSAHALAGHLAHCKANSKLNGAAEQVRLIHVIQAKTDLQLQRFTEMYAAHQLPNKDDLVYWNLGCKCHMCGAVASVEFKEMPGCKGRLVMVTVSGIHIKDHCDRPRGKFHLPADTIAFLRRKHACFCNPQVNQQSSWQHWNPAWRNFEAEFVRGQWERRESQSEKGNFVYWNVGR